MNGGIGLSSPKSSISTPATRNSWRGSAVSMACVEDRPSCVVQADNLAIKDVPLR
jgi:hypothetical protein